MGEDALDSRDDTVEDVQQDDVVVEKTESAEGTEGAEGSEQLQETDSLDIVRRSDEGSQPKAKKQTGKGIQKAFRRLTSQRDTAKGETAEVSNELLLEREKNKLLTLSLEQHKSNKPSELPNPEDYDDGVNDPKYIEAHGSHIDSLVDAKVNVAFTKSAGNLTATQDKAAQDTELRNRQTKHYERADLLGAKDYADTEDKAIDILGVDNVNHFIRASDNSEIVLYYLGKNPDEAEEIAALIKTNPVKATLQLGRLEADLKVKPRDNSNPAPNPDEELEGGSPGAGNSKQTKYERQLDALRTQVANGTKTMSDIIAFKKNHLAKGAA